MTVPPNEQLDISDATVLAHPDDATVAWVEVEGEVVAWNEAEESLHLLDPISTLVFHLIDGQASLGETITDLAQAFDRSESTVRPDVLRIATELVEIGLVNRPSD